MQKPTLTLADANKMTAADVAQLYERLTGKKMTKEGMAYAEAKLSGSGNSTSK